MIFPRNATRATTFATSPRWSARKRATGFSRWTRRRRSIICARFAAGLILDGIRKDLENFGVTFDRWFSEQSLYDSGKVEAVIEDFENRGIVYSEDGRPVV